MKTKILIASLAVMANIPDSSATTVGFAFAFGGASRTVVTDAGSTLASTSLVMVGAFANPVNVIFNSAQSIQENFTRVSAQAGWTEFAPSNTTDDFRISATGRLAGTATDTSTSATFLNGKQIYVWIFDAATIAASVQMGVYTALADPTWLFPTNGTVGDSTNLGTTVAVNITPVNGTGNVTPTQIQLVPEPSTAFLSAVGLIAVASRRRRNRN